jgi:hypothetical protein
MLDYTFYILPLTNSDSVMWNRPPTWLLVDFYDVGKGSVFEVAAKANGVTYDRACCGATSTSAAANVKGSAVALLVALAAALLVNM